MDRPNVQNLLVQMDDGPMDRLCYVNLDRPNGQRSNGPLSIWTVHWTAFITVIWTVQNYGCGPLFWTVQNYGCGEALYYYTINPNSRDLGTTE